MHRADRVRNVALVGHRGSGKTSVNEALLYQAGAINRLGSVLEGTTASDSDPDEQARQMSISASLSSFEWDERKINLIDTPGEPSFVADSLGALRVCESAIFVINAVMGAEVNAIRLWQRAEELDLARMLFVNMLDRERADFFRTLESLKGAFGPHVVATEIPIGSEHEIRGVDRPRRHEGLRVRRRRARQRARGPDPRRAPGPGAGVPREAHGRGRRGLRRAHGALPRGRGDLPRGDRHRAEGRHQPRRDLPRGVRRRDQEPRHQPPARRDRRGPAEPGEARRLRAARDHPGARRGQGAVRLRVQDEGRPVRRAHQLLPRLPGRDEARQPGAQHARPRQGAHRHADRAPGPRAGPRRRLRAGRHRRRGQAQGDARRRLAGRARRADRDARAGAAPARHGLRHRAQGQGRRGQGLHLAAPAAGGGPDHRPAPRPADRRPDRRRPLADPRRDRRRPPEVALRRRGHAQAAAGPLPGDDPQAGQGPRAPQEADRRPRAVRRLPHRDRAAARRHRLRVRQRHQGRRDPDRLHPGGREGLHRGHAVRAPWPASRSRA